VTYSASAPQGEFFGAVTLPVCCLNLYKPVIVIYRIVIFIDLSKAVTYCERPGRHCKPVFSLCVRCERKVCQIVICQIRDCLCRRSWVGSDTV